MKVPDVYSHLLVFPRRFEVEVLETGTSGVTVTRINDGERAH